MTPQRRNDRLVVEELAEETLVYDLDRHRAHCLNKTAAAVWRNCDGKRTIAELAAMLPRESKESGGEDVVLLALNQLQKRHLLLDEGHLNSAAELPTRR